MKVLGVKGAEKKIVKKGIKYRKTFWLRNID